MGKRLALFVAAAGWLCASPALAQVDGPGLLNGLPDTLGYSVGSSFAGRSTIMVTARGVSDRPDTRAAPPARQGYFHTVTVSQGADTAVAADRARDAIVDRLRVVARRFNAELESVEQPFRFAGDDPMEVRRRQRMLEQEDAEPLPPESPVTASSTVSFRMRDAERLPGLIDAVSGEGISRNSVASYDYFNATTNALHWMGMGTIEYAAEDPRFAAATREAMEAAEVQARDLASGAGGRIGRPLQVTLLTRTLVDEQAVVIVAVRYQLELVQ